MIGLPRKVRGRFAATAEGATRDEALAKLRADSVARAAGVEIVRITIPIRSPISREPV